MDADDLITRAARLGLLDEASARAAVGDRAPTAELLVERGLLRAQDLDRLRKPSGDRYDRYTLLRLLGSGGFGAVHLAWDPQLDRHVALKILKFTDSGERARFVRKALEVDY